MNIFYLSTYFFFLGIFLFFARTSFVMMLIALEFLVISSVLLLVYFSLYINHNPEGIVATFFILLIGAIKAALGLALFIKYNSLKDEDKQLILEDM